MDKYIATLVAAAFAAACASHDNPPAASAASIQEASNTPATGPGFAPASNDGTASAPADSQANLSEHRRTKPPPVVGGTPPSEADAVAPPPTNNEAALPARDTASRPDNSRVNERDRGGRTLTPMDQGPSEGDRKITQLIRQAVVKDGSLSFTAKNVKIITIGGKVTLRGPVKTDAERSAIEAEAKNVAGVSQVDNQLEVKN